MSGKEKKKSTEGNQGSANGSWVVRGPIPMTSSLKSKKRTGRRQNKNGVFVGPSVEGVDKKYVKVISGAVDDKKPSFA
ncbi:MULTISPECIES: hypothetical protein [Paenibacillus]|uniref:Uncharacterized protein n=1 Tax=Paenibacillus campinasensis TaxID=66347 RepID=A0A268EWY3_9BACL|nr:MULTISPECIES: hypothetical protein [Paenibacillus]MUG66004.1 hypothetical protein [Paenibacillus campinasensis]PAD77627.1 hypothetical protein CHH67_09190 [Paenibacillus campinasensis]PAK49769.1 hypothetical protein CHH75_19515 [Paenibacillus sp. 7541]